MANNESYDEPYTYSTVYSASNFVSLIGVICIVILSTSDGVGSVCYPSSLSRSDCCVVGIDCRCL